MFVPGFMQRGEAWAEVAGRVGQRYRVHLLDHRASTFAGRLEEIAAAAPAGSVLAGYSLGGRLALHAALRGPGHHRALVLVGAGAGIEDAAARVARRARDHRLADWMETQPIERVVDHWQSLPVFDEQPPELVASQRPGRLAHDPGSLAELLRSAGQGELAPVWDRLGDLRLPVLAMAGERDAPYVEAARRLAATLPDGEAQVVPRAGHAAHLEQPDAVAHLLLGFLSRLDGGPAAPTAR